MVSIRRAAASEAAATVCRSVASTLPEYFMAEDLDAIERDAASHGCWLALADGRPIAFVTIERRSAEVAEIVWMATAHKWRGQGVGRALLACVVDELSGTGLQLVEVKTLDALGGYEPYDATNAFWRKQGFVQIDTLDPYPGWRAGNPAAIYVCALAATR